MEHELNNSVFTRAIQDQLKHFFLEDDLGRNAYYTNKLPSDLVKCNLKIKDDLILSGLPYFFETFNYLLNQKIDYSPFLKNEGLYFSKSDKHEIHFELPFSVALTGERIALNLLQRSSAISTFTNQFVEKAIKKDIKILDTRKTTPGLRALEKYAVRIGGGYNHRLGQTDTWMVKDNHKKIFGGLSPALDFFKKQGAFYNSLVLEIHNLEELKEAIELKINHVMLDNFSPDEIKSAVSIKPENMTFEVSGGITFDSIDAYLINGVDAISIGALTYNAPHKDLSLKFDKK